MKILMWITLYFVIGMIIAAIVSKGFRNDRGYSTRSFDDLDSDEQTIMAVALLFWPIVIVAAVFYVILDGITKITNRKDDSE